MGRSLDRLKALQRKYAARVAALMQDGMTELDAKVLAKQESSDAAKALRAKYKGTSKHQP